MRILEQRLRWRGIPVEVKRVNHGQAIDLSGVDLVMLGGGPDREQRLASAELMNMREQLHATWRTAASCWPSAAATRFSATSGCWATRWCRAWASST